MGWQAVVTLNLVSAVCYVLIAALIAHGLVQTRQVLTNPLAVATAAIFVTCAIHHSHHSLHLLTGSGKQDLAAVRAVFGEWHSVLVDVLGALMAVVYLGLRRTYKTLLHTPAMFEDAVRVEAERRLGELAFTDGLTGVPNRAAYQQYADALGRDDVPVTVCFIDLDGFKTVNDVYGHDTGDRLLQDVAQGVASGLVQERLFRIGGDEFAVVALGLDPAGVQELVRRIGDLITRPITVRGGEVVVRASIGVASGGAGVGLDRVLREADADMYRIKARSLVGYAEQ